MDLYKYEQVENDFDSDSDGDTDALAKRIETVNKRKGAPGSQSATPATAPKAKVAKRLLVPALALDGDEAELVVALPKVQSVVKLSAIEEARKLLSSKPKIHVEDPVKVVEAKGNQGILDALLAKGQSMKQSLKNIEAQEVDIANKIAKDTTRTLQAIVIPVIERAVPRFINSDAAELSVDLIAGACASQVNPAATMKLKTRLKNHEWVWMVDPKDKLSLLKEQFATVYKVPSTEISLVFDGDVLKNDVTPASAGLESDDLLDVKIGKRSIDDAIASAEAYKASHPKGAPSASAATSSLPSAPTQPSAPSTKAPIKTPNIPAPAPVPVASDLAGGSLVEVEVHIPKEFSEASEDSIQMKIKAYDSFFLKQIHVALRKHVRHNAFALALANDATLLDLNSSLRDAGVMSGVVVEVRESPVVEILVNIGADNAKVKVPQYQPCSIMMGRIVAAVLKIPLEQVEFSFNGTRLLEEATFAEYGISSGSVVNALQKP
jgi:hypothetical protein